MKEIIIIAHNIRSAHNIGALFRTADGFGVSHIYLTGFSPYPTSDKEQRLPHIAKRAHSQIAKTSLGAENFVSWSYTAQPNKLLDDLLRQNYELIGLEQNKQSILLNDFKPPNKCALLLGNELTGITNELIKKCTKIVEIKMYGTKESFNVTQAAAVCLYHLRES